jgi:hypothetical protein
LFWCHFHMLISHNFKCKFDCLLSVLDITLKSKNFPRCETFECKKIKKILKKQDMWYEMWNLFYCTKSLYIVSFWPISIPQHIICEQKNGFWIVDSSYIRNFGRFLPTFPVSDAEVELFIMVLNGRHFMGFVWWDKMLILDQSKFIIH